MARLTKNRSRKTGLPPGSLVYIGEQKTSQPLIEFFTYNEDNCRRTVYGAIDEVIPKLKEEGKHWLNIDGLNQAEIIQKLGDFLDLHPLLQEDILNTEQRPKVEEYDTCLFMIVKMLSLKNRRISAEQVSLVLGTDVLISFQEQPGDVFNPVRERLQSPKSRIRKTGVDYLTYALIDTVVDNYFEILENLDEELERVEEEVTVSPTSSTLRKIYHLKREVLLLRKSAWPLREVVSYLGHSESDFIREETGVFFKDIYDHVIQVIDTIETFQELLSGMLDIYLSSASNRMNEVMKVLTVFSTIFMPLTFIVGLYGMNFKYMPELRWHWGYFAVLGVMAVIAGLMAAYFKRKKWL